jgi:hypothetical protein
LQQKQDERWQQESVQRSQRLPRGFNGIWFRITGKYHKLREQNERETETCRIRDRDETQSLVERQFVNRQKLQDQIQPILSDYKLRVQDLRQEIGKYMEMGGTPPHMPHEGLAQRQKDRDIDYPPEPAG